MYVGLWKTLIAMAEGKYKEVDPLSKAAVLGMLVLPVFIEMVDKLEILDKNTDNVDNYVKDIANPKSQNHAKVLVCFREKIEKLIRGKMGPYIDCWIALETSVMRDIFRRMSLSPE